MLYTKKEIEKIYSNMIVDYISKGARIDFSQGDYSSSQFDNHIDLIADDGCRIIIYITTNAADRGAFRRYDRGLCEIVVEVSKPEKNSRGFIYYPRDNAEKFIAYTFFRYKDIYTDDREQYNIMVATESERRHVQYEYERNMCRINYNPSVVLDIVRKRSGFKRTKAEHIEMVEKRDGTFCIWVNNGKKTEIIKVGRYK